MTHERRGNTATFYVACVYPFESFNGGTMRKRSRQLRHLKFWFLIGFLLLSWILYPSSLPSSIPKGPGEIAFIANQADQDLQKTLYHYLNSAKRSIWIASYNLSDRTTLKIINKKAAEGITVHLVYDRQATKDLGKRCIKKVKLHPCEFDGLMHIKLVLIDSNIAIWGSANMTLASLRYHGNLFLITQSEPFTQHLQKLLEAYSHQQDPKGKWKAPLFFTLSSPGMGQQKVEFYPLPFCGEGALKAIKQGLHRAKKSIRIDIFTWTRFDLAHAVIGAHRRGVKVSVTIDRDSAYGASAKVVQLLKKNGVSVRESRGDGLYHHKMVTIDETVWIGGSANWTKAGFEKNREIVTLISPLNPKQVAILQKIWKRTDAEYRLVG
jgi:phosphatidylserine/phosphatidylglycerophosphate/cardiolipin synthase-like enzyme